MWTRLLAVGRSCRRTWPGVPRTASACRAGADRPSKKDPRLKTDLLRAVEPETALCAHRRLDEVGPAQLAEAGQATRPARRSQRAAASVEGGRLRVASQPPAAQRPVASRPRPTVPLPGAAAEPGSEQRLSGTEPRHQESGTRGQLRPRRSDLVRCGDRGQRPRLPARRRMPRGPLRVQSLRRAAGIVVPRIEA